MVTKNQAQGSGGDQRKGDSDYIDREKMMLAKKNAKELYNCIFAPHLSIDKMKWICAQTTPPSELSAYDLVVKELNGFVEREADPYDDIDFMRRWRDYLRRSHIKLSETYDSVTQVAMRDYMQPEGSVPFGWIYPQGFLDWVGPGQLLLLYGEKGFGKSDMACKIGEGGVSKYPINGNIEIAEAIDGYSYCRRFSNMIRLICETQLKGKTSITLLDEMGIQFSSFKTTTSDWRSLEPFCLLTRKLNSALVWIAQYYERIPSEFRDHHSAWIRKESKRSLVYQIEGGSAKGRYEVRDVEPTSWKFVSKHVAGMRIDVSIGEMLDFLDGLPPKANQPQEIIRFLDIKEAKGWTEFTEWEKELLAYKLRIRLPELKEFEGWEEDDYVKLIGKILDASKKKVVEFLGKRGIDPTLEEIA